jgi:hypothetical protein
MNPEAKNRLAQILLGLLLLFVMGGSALWFFDNFERREREVRSEHSPQARRNPFLAAERYLGRLGFEVQSLSGRKWLTQPPAEPGVLLVNHLGPSLPPEREEALLHWVERGGHLIVVARQTWDDDTQSNGNSLLDRLGVRVHRHEVPEEDGDDTDSEIDLVQMQLDKEQNASGNPVYEMTFRADRVLEDGDGNAGWSLAGEQGVHLLEWGWGKGWITVLSDNELLTNDAIGDRDNAWFLSYLVSGEQNIWLLYSSNMPSLLTLLWRNTPYLVVSAALLLVLFIWHLTQRSGPLLVETTRVRRNLLEHLQAAAGFAWHTDRAELLFSGSQARVEQRWRRRHPVLERLGNEERSQWIANKTGLADKAVLEALYGTPDSEQALIRVSAIQQKLMKHLSRTANR